MTFKLEIHPTAEEIRKRFIIGWFGVPGGPVSRSTKVHIVKRRDRLKLDSRGVIVCGSKIGLEQEFQWCAPGYGLADDSLIYECQKCYKIASKWWIQWHVTQIKRTKSETIAWHKKQIKLHKKQLKLIS